MYECLITSHKESVWIIDSCCTQILYSLSKIMKFASATYQLCVTTLVPKWFSKMWFFTLELRTHIYRHQKPNCQYFHETLELWTCWGLNCKMVECLHFYILMVWQLVLICMRCLWLDLILSLHELNCYMCVNCGMQKLQ